MPRRASLFVFLGFAVALVLVTGISAGAESGGIRAKKADVDAAQDLDGDPHGGECGRGVVQQRAL
jgi:hypothetical protein